jgi:hypothetical protein
VLVWLIGFLHLYRIVRHPDADAGPLLLARLSYFLPAPEGAVILSFPPHDAEYPRAKNQPHHRYEKQDKIVEVPLSASRVRFSLTYWAYVSADLAGPWTAALRK